MCFGEFDTLIGGHSWCAEIPEMLAVTQLVMRPTEIVGTSDQIHSCLKCLKTLGGMPTFTSERSKTFTHRCIKTFNH